MKVGDYVITNDRLHIGKIYNINEFREPSMMYAIDFPNADDFIFMGENDFKSSPNTIDLIEVGDYVNGYKVTMLEDEYYDDVTDSVKKIKDKEKIKIILGNEEQFYGIYAKDIKSIVTKEQFESMEYKVGE